VAAIMLGRGRCVGGRDDVIESSSSCFTEAVGDSEAESVENGFYWKGRASGLLDHQNKPRWRPTGRYIGAHR